MTRKEHDHSACSNNKESFLTFVGCRVKGYTTVRSCATLIFECGWGLTFNSTGSYWVSNPEEVAHAIELKKEALREAGG